MGYYSGYTQNNAITLKLHVLSALLKLHLHLYHGTIFGVCPNNVILYLKSGNKRWIIHILLSTLCYDMVNHSKASIPSIHNFIPHPNRVNVLHYQAYEFDKK